MWRLLLTGAATLALAGAMYLAGQKAGTDHATAAWRAADLAAARSQLAQAAKDRAESTRLAEAVDQLASRQDQRTTEIRWRTQTIREQVPTYVTPESDRLFPVPVGFVQLHDAAAAGTAAPSGDPIAALIASRTASGVALSAVTDTIVSNYGDCHTWRNQVIGWQAWWGVVKPTLRPGTISPPAG